MYKEMYSLELELLLSNHAWIRAVQWHLSYEEIVFIRKCGHKLPNAGAAFRQLRQDTIPASLPGNHRLRELVGSTVVLCPTCESYVITVYRNPAAFQKDKRKKKYNRKEEESSCPYCHPRRQAD